MTKDEIIQYWIDSCYVKYVDNKVPRIHHLLKIAESANLELSLVSLANITSVKLRKK